MSTYPIEKILFDYEHNRMDGEMALGHSLQHISKLYAAQASADAERQLLRQKVNALEAWLQTLQAKSDRVQTLPESLITLQRTLALLQHKVDNLIAQTTLPSQQSKQG
ncbi:MAG: hypothetical protein U0350_33410 [Caldilineaceae bacterium]